MPSFKEDSLKKEIISCFPEFREANIVFNHNGWTSVIAEIDSKYVCKFPRNEEKLSFLKKEKELIEILKKNLKEIQFPNRTYINAKHPFFIHEKIQGEFFTTQAYYKASESEKYNFIESIAIFFKNLHDLNKDEFHNLIPQKTESITSPMKVLSFIQEDLSDHNSRLAEKILADFVQCDDTSLKVVGYYDMHPYNCVVERTNKKLLGIFDFDEMAIGTPRFDLREIFLNYNEDIGKCVLDSYNSKIKNAISLKSVKTALVAWSFYEYMRMKVRKDSELKGVTGIDVNEFRDEISSLIENYAQEYL